jgi:hypothetical protein
VETIPALTLGICPYNWWEVLIPLQETHLHDLSTLIHHYRPEIKYPFSTTKNIEVVLLRHTTFQTA